MKAVFEVVKASLLEAGFPEIAKSIVYPGPEVGYPWKALGTLSNVPFQLRDLPNISPAEWHHAYHITGDGCPAVRQVQDFYDECLVFSREDCKLVMNAIRCIRRLAWLRGEIVSGRRTDIHPGEYREIKEGVRNG